jgi:hypothetical protein
LSQANGAEPNIEWVSECFTDYIENHKECSSSLIPQRFGNIPNRLLEISSLDGLSETKLRLIEISDLKEIYIALSHSWGTYQPLCSTTKTIAHIWTESNLKIFPKRSKMP